MKTLFRFIPISFLVLVFNLNSPDPAVGQTVPPQDAKGATGKMRPAGCNSAIPRGIPIMLGLAALFGYLQYRNSQKNRQIIDSNDL
jgi:hypothetical protein